MKPLILKLKQGLSDYVNPWDPWDHKIFWFVVRAETEEDTQQIAQSQSGDESKDKPTPWLNPKLSICSEVTFEGERDVILKDFASA
jgi:hypothetical protein